MRKIVLFLVLLMAVGATAGIAQQDGQANGAVNLSAERTLGVGMQLDFPWGGLLSARYWFLPHAGGEVILFLWGEGSDVEGTVTVRGLARIADQPVVDFYGAGGVSVPFTRTGGEPVYLSAAGGIEFGFGFAPSLAWNIEFGVAYRTDGEVSMLFGTGIHFYF